MGIKSRVETRLKISKLVDPTFLTSTSARERERAIGFLKTRVALKTRPDSPDPNCLLGGPTPISHDPHAPLFMNALSLSAKLRTATFLDSAASIAGSNGPGKAVSQ